MIYIGVSIFIITISLYAFGRHANRYLLEDLTISDFLIMFIPAIRLYYLFTSIHIINRQREWKTLIKALKG